MGRMNRFRSVIFLSRRWLCKLVIIAFYEEFFLFYLAVL